MKISIKQKILIFYFLFFSVFILNVKALTLQQIHEKGELVCATNAEFPPWESRDGDEIKGVDIELAQKIAERLGINLQKKIDLKINDIAFDAIILELANKKCDIAIAAMSSNEEKQKSTDFSEPYFRAGQSVLVRENGNIKTFEDLKNEKIGVTIGSTGQSYCEERYENVIPFNNLSDTLVNLKSGSISAIVVDEHPAKNSEIKYRGEIKCLDGFLFHEDYCVAVPKGSDELLLEINKIIKDLKSEGLIESWVKKYTQEKVESNRTLKDQFYDNLIEKDRYKLIFKGLVLTFEIAIFAVIIGIIIGFISAIIICLDRDKFYRKSVSSNYLRFIIMIFSNFFRIYINIIRGTPIVCQLFIVYYIIFSPLGIDKVLAAIVAFGINSGAYVSEIVRNAILSVDKGQVEAAQAMGLKGRLTFFHIIVPQAIKNSLPLFCNEIIQLIKETSVAGLIGIIDLSRASEVIRSQTLEPLVPLMTVAIIYFFVIFLINFLMKIFENKLRISDNFNHK